MMRYLALVISTVTVLVWVFQPLLKGLDSLWVRLAMSAGIGFMYGIVMLYGMNVIK